MPLPSGLVSVNLLICERVLSEADSVLSAIRIVDIFHVPAVTDEHSEPAKVALYVLFISKFVVGDIREHTLQLCLIGPSGERKTIGDQQTASLKEARYPDLPSGFNIVVQLAVKITQPGTHYVTALVDGEEVARTPFTLLERKPEATQ